MVNRFCPKCGAQIKKGTFCESCSAEKIKIDVPLIQISEFNRTYHKGSWQPFQELEDLIIKRIREAAGKDYPVDVEPFEFEAKPKEKIIVTANVLVAEDEEITLSIPVSYRQCDYGQKQKTQYFEGILQLQNPTEKVIDFISKQMESMAPKGVFITKTVDTKKGVDLYFTKKNPMRIIAQKVVSKFGGKMDENAQLFTHNHLTSRDVFRLNIHVQLPEFTLGDVIEFDLTRVRGDDLRHVIQVNKMGKVIQGTDLLTGKQLAFELKFAKEIKKVKPIKTTLISVQPTIQVLHPETYQAQTPRNADVYKHDLNIEDKVDVVMVKEGILLIYDV
ncbi:hypothetical protein JXA48_01010 [Candidatus Woesearchaeota archaeon]|nr:hypothetical protein [Candidatus Woesearchaeota archaeon]